MSRTTNGLSATGIRGTAAHRPTHTHILCGVAVFRAGFAVIFLALHFDAGPVISRTTSQLSPDRVWFDIDCHHVTVPVVGCSCGGLAQE